MSIDHVTLANLSTGSAAAGRRAEQTAVALMARHLRYEHGMSWRKIAQRLNVSVREVREMVPDVTT